MRFDYSQRTVGYGMWLTMRLTIDTLCLVHNREIQEYEIQEMRRNERTMRVYGFNKAWLQSDEPEMNFRIDAIFVRS